MRCDFFGLLDDSFAFGLGKNLASSARSRQTRTSPVLGESSRVSIREHAILVERRTTEQPPLLLLPLLGWVGWGVVFSSLSSESTAAAAALPKSNDKKKASPCRVLQM